MGKFKINGVELELDLMEADTLAAFEQCMKDVSERVQDEDSYEGDTVAEKIKYQCRIVREGFEKLFDAGTVKKIFAGKENNLFVHMKAFSDLVGEGQKCAAEMKALAAPFVPNRAQRRAGDKKKKKKNGKKR